MSATVTALDPALEGALAACGWQAETSGQWTRQTTDGPATLRYLGDRGDWQQFVLEGGSLVKTSSAKALSDNDRLYGPVKFVAAPGRPPFCRADLPKEFPSMAQDDCEVGEDGLADGFRLQDPRRAWAAAISVAAGGEPGGLSPAAPDARLVQPLADAGWSASLDDGQLHVHLHMPGLFRQVWFELQDPPGMKIAVDLLSLEGVRGGWLKAALRLAQAANRRLPLVRLAITQDTKPRVLRAEVHVGCAVIPGGWLPTALEALEAAVSLVARELQALRDPELAQLVLAARGRPDLT